MEGASHRQLAAQAADEAHSLVHASHGAVRHRRLAGHTPGGRMGRRETAAAPAGSGNAAVPPPAVGKAGAVLCRLLPHQALESLASRCRAAVRPVRLSQAAARGDRLPLPGAIRSRKLPGRADPLDHSDLRPAVSVVEPARRGHRHDRLCAGRECAFDCRATLQSPPPAAGAGESQGPRW